MFLWPRHRHGDHGGYLDGDLDPWVRTMEAHRRRQWGRGGADSGEGKRRQWERGGADSEGGKPPGDVHGLRPCTHQLVEG